MEIVTIVRDDTLFFKGVTTELRSPTRGDCLYTPGTTVTADELELDPSIECAPGIFFCRTLPVALKWAKGGTVVSVKPIGVIVDTGTKLRAASVEVIGKINLSDANLSYADLSGADLRGANLSYADLRGANLSYAYLSGADLRGANLSYADLRGANLSYADLRGANLSYAYLSGADLRGADLRGANLSYAYLSGADLRSARNKDVAIGISV